MRPDLQKRLLRVSKVIRKLAAIPGPAPRTLAQELEAKIKLCYDNKGVLSQERAGFLLRKLNEIVKVVTDPDKKAVIQGAIKRLLGGLATGQVNPPSVTAKFHRAARALSRLVK